MQVETIEILETPVENFRDMDACLLAIDSAMSRKESAVSAVALNPEKILRSHELPELRSMLQWADIRFADGIGVVHALRWLKKQPHVQRIPGVELFVELVEQAAKKQRSIYLFGATAAVVEEAATKLQQRFPALTVAGYCDGFSKLKSEEEMFAEIRRKQPDYLFVALGTPRQELWIHKNHPKLAVRFVMGVGGSFDVVSGRVKRAPEFMQKLGLEWAHRLILQPSRIVRMLALPKFVWLVWRRRS